MSDLWKRARDFYVYATAWNMGDDPEPHVARARETQAKEWDRAVAAIEREAAARALEEAASDWAADPDSWGDNEKDYRNELRARAAEIRSGS